MSTQIVSPVLIIDTSFTDSTGTLQIVPKTIGIPHAPTSALTATLVVTGTGNVTNGTHSYRVTFTDGHGYESSAGPSSNIVTVDATHKQVDLSNIPLGPTATGNDGLNATVNRKIYRTIAGNTGSPKLLATISDNTTTIFTDNVADGSLGVAAPGITVTPTTSVI